VEPVPVLFCNGALKGQIREVSPMVGGLVNIELVDPSRPFTVDDWDAAYYQVHYRWHRITLIDRCVYIGWCGPESQPSADALLDTLLSDVAKQLLKLTSVEG
jgi:hypothetical protein